MDDRRNEGDFQEALAKNGDGGANTTSHDGGIDFRQLELAAGLHGVMHAEARSKALSYARKQNDRT